MSPAVSPDMQNHLFQLVLLSASVQMCMMGGNGSFLVFNRLLLIFSSFRFSNREIRPSGVRSAPTFSRVFSLHMSGTKKSIEIVDVIDNGALKVEVFFHDIVVKAGTIQPAWTFVTRGLFELGNKEMVMTLKCGPGEMAQAFKTNGRNFPEAVLHLFANIYDDHFSSSGEGHVDEAMWYEWPEIEGAESPYFLNKEKWVAFIFGPPDYLAYPDLEGLFLGNRPYMSVQPIFEDEYEIVKRFGATRVISMMGQHLQAYPWPRFVDRDRQSVIPSNLDRSIILAQNKVFDAGEQVVLSDLCAVLELEKKIVSLRFPQHQLDLLKTHLETLAPNSGLIFNLTIAPHADSHLYWNPGKSNPAEFNFIKKPVQSEDQKEIKPQLIGGSFIAFIPRGQSDLITVHEDGFVAFISQISWAALRQCIVNGIDCKIKSDFPDGLELDLGFADDDLPEKGDDEEAISEEPTTAPSEPSS